MQPTFVSFSKASKITTSVFFLSAACALSLPAQTLNTLHRFDGTDGARSTAALIQSTSGELVGTTQDGGAFGHGTVFKIAPGGALTTLYSFCAQSGCTDGSTPYSGVIQASDGNFYGTTEYGGVLHNSRCSSGCGTIFQLTPSGALTTLHAFCLKQEKCADGDGPFAALVQAADGNLYGTTGFGGTMEHEAAFKITTTGMLTSVYSFCQQLQNGVCLDGQEPMGAMVQATDGNLYGTTFYGGTSNLGTAFSISPGGTLTTIHDFTVADGGGPASLIQATDGNLYGTAGNGGTPSCNPRTAGCGTVFKMSLGGAVTTVHTFCPELGCADGSGPGLSLIQRGDGNFYGTTYRGGTGCPGPGCGTIFALSAGGAFTTLYSFCSDYQGGCPDGFSPIAGLMQSTNGNFYGTTKLGADSGSGSYGDGTVFSLALSPGPF